MIVSEHEFKQFDGFGELVAYQTQTRPDSIALVHLEGDRLRRVTWRAFSADIDARAEELRASGKTCMAILADGSYACVRELFAANAAGLQIAMLDTAVPEQQLAMLLPYVDADTVWAPTAERAEALTALLHPQGGGVQDGAGKILFFTSGTTARSKAVVLTDRSLMGSICPGSAMQPLTPADTLLCTLPLGHVFGMACGMLWGMVCGATVALGRGGRHVFTDPMFFRPTAISVVPILLEHLLRRNLLNPELELILVGAGDCSEERLQEAADRGIRVAFGYGLTETSSGVAISTGDEPHAMEVCWGTTIELADDGEILISGPGMMEGYYKLPQDTAEVLVDGVLHTGDLGSFDENGCLHITGRKKEMLVLPGGTKIFLPEYEREIAETLGTSEMAVVLRKGLPVLVMGDLAASASEASAAAAANAYARANEAGKAVLNRLSGVMEGWPASQRLVDVVDLGRELPRTASGKVQRWIVQSELDKRWDEIRNMRKAGKATAPTAPTAETPAAEPAAATSPAGVTAAEPAADSAPAAEAPVAAPAQETAASATDSAAPASEE